LHPTGIAEENRSDDDQPRHELLAILDGSIERIETDGDACTSDRVALGQVDADAVLQGGLATDAMRCSPREAEVPRRPGSL